VLCRPRQTRSLISFTGDAGWVRESATHESCSRSRLTTDGVVAVTVPLPRLVSGIVDSWSPGYLTADAMSDGVGMTTSRLTRVPGCAIYYPSSPSYLMNTAPT